MTIDKSRVTQVLHGVSREGASPDELLPLVYDRLRAMAERGLRGRGNGVTLQPTALAHEVYLHLVDQSSTDWRDRAHFLAVAAIAMRQILIQRARARSADKRGGGWRRVEIDAQPAPDSGGDVHDILALDEALEELARLDARHARVVELRFFGGLTSEETAEVLGVSLRTVESDWRAARAWLRSALSG